MKKTSKEINALLEDLRGDNRRKIMLYLDKNIHENFKFFCMNKKIRMSTLVEKILRNFLEEFEEKKGK